jgi:alkylated DNA repair dioxygenase AlkB
VTASLPAQPSLFGAGAPSIDPRMLAGARRTALDDGAWVDRLGGWVTGHDTLMEALLRTMKWQQVRRPMYDRAVDVPRLLASIPDDGPGHPLLADIGRALAAHYETEFPHVSLAYYRDGADSVAFHGDTFARDLPEALVATVSLGEPRRFVLRPREGGRRVVFSLGWGDLTVMGGTCQRTWQHGIPKVAHALPRMSIMYRPTWYKP